MEADILSSEAHYFELEADLLSFKENYSAFIIIVEEEVVVLFFAHQICYQSKLGRSIVLIKNIKEEVVVVDPYPD